jgi:hypothetical protein
MTKEELIKALQDHTTWPYPDLGQKAWQAWEEYITEHWPDADPGAVKISIVEPALQTLIDDRITRHLDNFIESFVDHAVWAIEQDLKP